MNPHHSQPNRPQSRKRRDRSGCVGVLWQILVPLLIPVFLPAAYGASPIIQHCGPQTLIALRYGDYPVHPVDHYFWHLRSDLTDQRFGHELPETPELLGIWERANREVCDCAKGVIKVEDNLPKDFREHFLPDSLDRVLHNAHALLKSDRSHQKNSK